MAGTNYRFDATFEYDENCGDKSGQKSACGKFQIHKALGGAFDFIHDISFKCEHGVSAAGSLGAKIFLIVFPTFLFYLTH